MFKKYLLISLGLIFSLVIAGFLWWHYGSPLSEQSSLKLATDFAQDYAISNNIDLANYDKPKLRQQPVGRFYTFSWLPKSGGQPFVITVDAMTVDITVDESPN